MIERVWTAVAGDGDRLAGQGLAGERRDRAAVVGAHPRAVGVEDPHDRGVDAVRAPVGHGQRLGEPLGLVVDPARADRVDVTPVGLGLRVDLRVAVGLAGRGEQEAGALLLGQAQGVQRAERADLHRLDRQLEVVDRAGRAGEVQHLVDRAGDVDVLRHVGLHEPEPVVLHQVLDVDRRAGQEVVERDDLVAVGEQLLAQVRAQEAGPAGHDRSRHGAEPSRAEAAGLTPATRRAGEIRTRTVADLNRVSPASWTTAPSCDTRSPSEHGSSDRAAAGRPAGRPTSRRLTVIDRPVYGPHLRL